jgi:hypothetical protein
VSKIKLQWEGFEMAGGFGGLELAVEHVMGKARRAVQRIKTFSGSHQWRRNEAAAYASRDDGNDFWSYATRRGKVRSYSDDDSAGAASPETHYSRLSARMGQFTAEKVLSEYSPAAAGFILDVLDQNKLDISAMIDHGVFVPDKAKGTLYFLDKSVEAMLAEQGLQSSEFLQVQGTTELNYLTVGNNLVLITLPQEKQVTMPYSARMINPNQTMVRVNAATLKHHLQGWYKKDTAVSSHDVEHAFERANR